MNAEYESVLCAGLLHDIGKFYQRAQSGEDGHRGMSEAFIEAHRQSFEDPDLVKTLVAHHHESERYTPEADRPSAPNDGRWAHWRTSSAGRTVSHPKNGPMPGSPRATGRARPWTPCSPR